MIGREREENQLKKLYNSKKAHLVAVYGRRRVGKTYLINQTFKGRITFSHAGLSPLDNTKKGMLSAQLEHFYYSLIRQGMPEGKKPESWLEAFYMLEMLLEKKDTGKRQVVFLDELPWMDTQRSGFLSAFEAFWNSWGCSRENLMVVVCGSATSWMLDNLINNHGGLYGRVTCEIKLSPFSLKECEQFFKNNRIKLSRYDIVQSYMILGGIPYYMSYFEEDLSLGQNIDRLFFVKDAVLANEYDRLFDSVFANPTLIKRIVASLYTRNAGYTRNELIERLDVTDGGTFSKSLNALIASDFIIKYVPFGFKSREEHYKLVDPFCLYYLHFITNGKTKDPEFWEHSLSAQNVVTWRGFAFENVCFNHVDCIKKALGISGVLTSHSAWSKRDDDEDGSQVDLIIKRNDHVVNMCEMKYYSKPYKVDKDDHEKIIKREELLSTMIAPGEVVHNTLITTYDPVKNEYIGVFSKIITLPDLFTN